MSPEILLKKISFFYNQQCLFQNLDLQLPAGSCTCLLGPSGIGKSSLLQIIAGFALGQCARVSGTIVTDDLQPLHGRIMLMMQQDGLLPWRNALDNVLLGYRLRHTLAPEITQRAIELLMHVGLTRNDLIKKPHQLSMGMRQRIALIRTVMEDKPIWLLDEPFSALDALTRLNLQNYLAELIVDKTVLLVTHDPLEALRLADYLYVMVGNPAQLVQIAVPATSIPRVLDTELIDCQNQIFEILKRNTA
jgi:putative hydroxymethylpyrimidine transport system ATP-binding protein